MKTSPLTFLDRVARHDDQRGFLAEVFRGSAHGGTLLRHWFALRADPQTDAEGEVPVGQERVIIAVAGNLELCVWQNGRRSDSKLSADVALDRVRITGPARYRARARESSILLIGASESCNHSAREESTTGVRIHGVRAFRCLTGSDGTAFWSDRSWPDERPAKQWNALRTKRGALRGVHTHLLRHDYMYTACGAGIVGLRDLRPDSPSHGQSAFVHLLEEDHLTVSIPPGVAHGIQALEDSIFMYGLTHEWEGLDEFGCAPSDPELGLEWPMAPILSERDASAAPLRDLLSDIGDRLTGLEP